MYMVLCFQLVVINKYILVIFLFLFILVGIIKFITTWPGS